MAISESPQPGLSVDVGGGGGVPKLGGNCANCPTGASMTDRAFATPGCFILATGRFSLCPLGDRSNIQSKQRPEPQMQLV